MSQRNSWMDGVSERLIHYAARRAPDALSDRLAEEWLADMGARSGSGSRLRFAIGCCWATRVIAYEHQPSTMRMAGAAMGAKLAVANAHYSLTNFSRRSGTLFLVVTLHIALFYLLVSKLSHTHFTAPPAPVQNTIIDDPKPPKVLPQPPNKPTTDTAKIIVEPPQKIEIPLEPPVDNVPRVVDTVVPPVETQRVVTEPTPPAHVVQREMGGPGRGFPSPDDFYPDAAKRLGEQGSAVVQVCVDPKGRLTSEPRTVQGSGSVRLDNGALKLAKAASGHYRASTEDGRPVDSCYPFRIHFVFKD